VREYCPAGTVRPSMPKPLRVSFKAASLPALPEILVGLPVFFARNVCQLPISRITGHLTHYPTCPVELVALIRHMPISW
jgi:hypothetical protein